MEGVYYFEKYAPVVSWTTFILMLRLSTNQVWDTRKVDSSNNFVPATLVGYVYIDLPYYFEPETGEDRADMVIKLNKSLYVLVQPPLYW